jgi:NADPH:quinone reductase
VQEQSEAFGIKGYDYILATVGIESQEYFDSLTAVLNPFGHIASVLPPSTALNLGDLFIKRGSLHFELMFSRSMFGVEPERQHSLLTRVAEKVDQGAIRSTLTTTLPLWTGYREAQLKQESGSTIGKTALQL